MRKYVVAGAGSALALAALALGLSGSGWRTAEALTNCSTTTAALDGSEQQLLQLINGFRTSNGRAPLKASPNLSRAAAWMAEDLARTGSFSHTDSLGRSPFVRVTHCGYASSGAGENLALTSTAQSAFNLWVNSTMGHRENMLNPAWVVAGIGHAGNIWAADFGAIDDSNEPWDSGGAPPPPPPPPPAATATPTAPPASGGGGFAAPPPSGGSSPAPSSGGGLPSDPQPVRTVIAHTPVPQHKLPSNVPIKRAMLQMVSSE